MSHRRDSGSEVSALMGGFTGLSKGLVRGGLTVFCSSHVCGHNIGPLLAILPCEDVAHGPFPDA